MEGAESVMDSIYEVDSEGEILDGDDDVEMLDAENLACAAAAGGGSKAAGGGEAVGEDGGGSRSKNQKRRGSKKKNRKKKRGGGNLNVMDINRFVIDTCKHLKEKKPYLIWNAIGSLGVSAVSDLVKEVDAIQSCGGQKTADGKRFRNGGGILWNILKTREPRAFKEIMAKGKEFEKQFRQPNRVHVKRENDAANPHEADEEAIPQSAILKPAGVGSQELLDSSEHTAGAQSRLEPSDCKAGRTSVLERIRMPVVYDDLFEEGEIHDST